MNVKNSHKAKLSKPAIIICVVAVLFAMINIYFVDRMRANTEDIYEHPYTTTNTARGMRSRLLDMKRFVDILLTTSFESEEEARALFDEHYEMQNESITLLYECYLGPREDVDALHQSMNDLIEIQEESIQFAGEEHSEEETLEFINTYLYPNYDAVSERLETIISFSDDKVRSLTKISISTSTFSIVTTILLTFFLIFLTFSSNKVERNNIRVLTEREQELKDALLLAQKTNNAKKDFLSRMSHEIRTPMNAIVGMTTIAAASIEDRSRVMDCLEKISYSSKHLLMLINDVLDMSRIESDRMKINTEPFELYQFLNAFVSIIYPQARSKGVEFTEKTLGFSEQTTFLGDSLRLNQILLNIVSNAIKFTPRGGVINLEITKLPPRDKKIWIRFVVSDTGIGMDEVALSQLYKPFEQANSSISQKYGGTGLGMSITENLVSLMGGYIHVKSQPEKGTTFTVELPFARSDVELNPIGKEALEALEVLVADDEYDICEHTVLLLENMNIHAQWVLSGAEAVERIVSAQESGRGFDVCFIDWKMPDMDGVETARRIRHEVGPDTPIIIISAYDWSDIEAEAKAAGVNAFIAKPVFQSSIYNALVNVTNGSLNRSKSTTCVKGHTLDRIRILLAEDNVLNMEIATTLLGMNGAIVETVENGREAMECFLQAKPGHFDAILMDVQMPVMDGCEAARKIRSSEHPDAHHIPIIAVTANAFAEDIASVLEAGMNGHIGKPFNIEEVCSLLIQLCNNSTSTENN